MWNGFGQDAGLQVRRRPFFDGRGILSGEAFS
jgi:hypothetical protein